MRCLNCGKVINNKKFCSHLCSAEYYHKKLIIRKPPKYLICQNPNCKKELTHYIQVMNNDGTIKRWYKQNQKYCNKLCEAEHRKMWMKGNKGNLKSKNNERIVLSGNLQNFKPFDSDEDFTTDQLTFYKDIG